MDTRTFLHDGETLLAAMQASRTHLVAQILRGILEGFVVGGILAGAVAVGMLISGGDPSWWIAIPITLVLIAIIVLRRRRLWMHSSFRITTERILVDHHDSLFFSHPAHTIKWNQYQESYLGKRGPLDMLFGVRPLCIRYGTADARFTVCFPSLPYAQDLKHYLDKVDSAVRKHQESTLRPFVAKPRGQRDE